MNRLIVSLTVVLLLSGCELLKPVSLKEAQAEAGLHNHRTDVGGFYRYDNGRVEVAHPQPWRR
jgi:hypothetical protein